MDYIVQSLLALQESQIKANSTLSILEREQKQNESAMANIMTAVERGFYTASANKRMKELEDRQAELERLIIIERSKMQVKVSEKEIRAYYEAALLQEPQMLINFIIREIIVFDDEITSTSITPYRRVLTQVRAFLFATGKQRSPHIFRTRMS